MKKAIKNIKKVKGCWEWQGSKNGGGYGVLERNNKRLAAHRFFYENIVGKIPTGLEIDHLCRNRKCVNPKHLEPVTHSENVRRGCLAHPKKHCKKKHPYVTGNIYIIKGRKGFTYKRCKKCQLENQRTYRANKSR